MNKLKLWIAILPLAACATARPPQELVDARAAYAHAQASPTAKFVPADIHVAQESLDVAERSFADKPGSQDTIDDAYIAQRRAERAEALGRTAAATDAKLNADGDVTKTQAAIISHDAMRLRDTKDRLRDTQGALATERDSADKARQETANEHAARLAAEKKAQDAMDALSKSLAVRKEDRGTVITLSGGVLFATNQATILPGAQVQLNQVADALKTQAEHHFTVGGHTDNQGTDAINDDLSQRRAAAVRDYLVVRGVSANAISAQGFGSHQPLGENGTTEGRAMNRRVEIIVDKT